MSSIIKVWNANNIRIDPDNRYVCLTDMAKASGKLLGNWNQLDITKEYLSTLSSVIGIPITDNHAGLSGLICSIQGIGVEQGTWAHPKVAIRFAQWCDVSFAIQVDSWIDELLTTGKVEIQRENLEQSFAPPVAIPALKQIKEMHTLKKIVFGKAYAARWYLQIERKFYPALAGDAPLPEEMPSLPTARALLTPTQIAAELKVLYQSGGGNAKLINQKLQELGYQEKIQDRWSATAKAISANLCDRKPVDTNSRTQKDQLMWAAEILNILREHLIPAS